MGTSASWWDRFFYVTSRGSTLQTEIVAGCSTYLSLAYILVVNPAILSKGGFDASSVLFATAITFSLDKAMLIGFGAYSLRPLGARGGAVDPYLLGSFLLLVASVTVQAWFHG